MRFSLTKWRTAIAFSFLSLLCDKAQSDEAGTNLKLTLTTEGLTAPSPLEVRIDRSICGNTRSSRSVLLGPQSELANVLVWLDSEKPLSWPDIKRSEPTITIKDCEFNPRILIVRPGETFIVRHDSSTPAESRRLFNLHTRPRINTPIARVLPPNIDGVKLRFEKPEVIPIECDLHPWTQSFVVVAPHPFYAVTDLKGRATIKGIPIGTYRLKMWHEVLGVYPNEESINAAQKNLELKLNWKAH